MSQNDLKKVVNFNAVRAQFPIFKQTVHNHPFIYFDSAATAQMPQSVVDAIVDYYTTYKSNVGRGIYSFAEKATAAYEASRVKVADFIGANSTEIVFTSGATAGINLVAQSWAYHHLQAGDEILVSVIEHHSNFLPWQQLALDKELVLTVMPVNGSGIVDIDIFKQHLSSKTKLVALAHTSNVLGSTNDIRTITKMAHDVGAKICIDASQSVAHQKINVEEVGCDFLVFSGHKLFGPTGVGVLFVKKPLHVQMKLINFGGGMVFSVAQESSTFKSFPDCFEAGTPNIAQVIGLGAAIDFIDEFIDFKQLQAHETMLAKILSEGLQQFPDITLVSPFPGDSQHGHMVTFYSKTHHGHDIAAFLDQYGIAVRAGHHCAQLFHQQCGIHTSVRVSFSVYNTVAELVFFLECLKRIF